MSLNDRRTASIPRRPGDRSPNRDLQCRHQRWIFRSDLFKLRLHVFPIADSAMRERREDILPFWANTHDRYAESVQAGSGRR